MLKPEDCVLVVVDVQGQLARVMHQSEALHQKLTILIKGVQLFDIPILWLEQLPDKLGATTDVLATELIRTTEPIAKQHFSGWQCPKFRAKLSAMGQKHILVAGIETHVCVYQTCMDLLDNAYPTHLIVDAMSSRTPENKQLGIEMMQEHGALKTNVESLLFELQHEAIGEDRKSVM